MQIAMDVRRIKSRTRIILFFPYLVKEPADRDPIIAPKLVVEVTMTLQLLAVLSSHLSIAWKHVNILPQEAIPKPSKNIR